MAPRTIAVGDVHGCLRALQKLLEAISPAPDDTLIFLGDYIDRGPDSRGVLDQLISLVPQCVLVPLLGNHEIMLLDAVHDPDTLEFWRHCGGQETLDSYGGSLDQIPEDHFAFMRGLRPYFETETHLFVHANYDEQLPLSQTPESRRYWEHITIRLPKPHISGKKVVVGHTPQASGQVLDLGFVVCIDTYCFGGQWLTGMELATGRVWQANQNGDLRTL